METLKLATLLAIGIGCLLGVSRYVLDDKWDVLPKRLCRFCLTFWVSCFLNWIVCGVNLYIGNGITVSTISLILGTAIASAASSITYVYIKNAN